MDLQKLTDQQVEQSLKSLIQKEREILSEIVAHILEIERRKFFLKMAYSSLFDYLTKHLGYSAGSAQRRIDAARLMKEIPELSAKLESGVLNLSQISLVQKAIRASKAINAKQAYQAKEALRLDEFQVSTSNTLEFLNKTEISSAHKREILASLENKSFFESQTILAKAFDLPVEGNTKITNQKDESVRLEVTLTKSQW